MVAMACGLAVVGTLQALAASQPGSLGWLQPLAAGLHAGWPASAFQRILRNHTGAHTKEGAHTFYPLLSRETADKWWPS